MGFDIYEFNLPVRIIFGFRCLERLNDLLEDFDRNVLLITGRNFAKKSGLIERIEKLLKDFKVDVFSEITPEPTCSLVNRAIEFAKEKKSKLVIGLGGGSVIDAAKAVAGLANKRGRSEDYLRGIKKIDFKGLDFIAIPTTSGTGAEVTPNAVLIDEDRIVKHSLRSKFLFAKMAIVDPELTLSLPKELTVYCGLDALSQSIESFVSAGASPLTDGICLESIRLILENILKVYKNPNDVVSRINMSYASLLSGIALCNARMGAVHGIAHPLGALYKIHHGLLCGLLLPYVMEFNLEKVKEKYAVISSFFGIKKTSDREVAERLILEIKRLLKKLNFPSNLKELNVKIEDFPKIAKDAYLHSGSLKANPIEVKERDIIKILNRAYRGG
jgi:alcohol dehydrogenase